jgi:hypothetical protein
MAEIRGEQKEIGWGSQIRSYVFHPAISRSCSSNLSWYNLDFNIFIAASRFLICERSFWLLTTIVMLFLILIMMRLKLKSILMILQLIPSEHLALVDNILIGDGQMNQMVKFELIDAHLFPLLNNHM